MQSSGKSDNGSLTAGEAAAEVSVSGALDESSQRSLALLVPAAYGLLVLALFCTLYFASALLIPVAAALLLNVIFAPLIRGLQARGLPAPLGAGLIVASVSASLVVAIVLLSDPVRDWLDRLPIVAWEIKETLQSVLEPLQKDVMLVTKEVDDLAKVAGVGDEKSDGLAIKGPSISAQVFESIQTLVLHLVIISALLFFLLAAGDLFKARFVAMVPRFHDKRQVLKIIEKIEANASSYILTVTAINAGLGAAIGFSLWLLGLPNAPLWGLMAALLNFIPFAGAIVGATIVAMVSLIANDSTMTAAVAPMVYLGINVVEAQFLTPAILGRKLTLNPVAILIFVLLWGWLWGVPGGLMAVPLLVVLRAFCGNIASLQALSLLLDGEGPRARGWRQAANTANPAGR